jgi:hypothetical protein
MADDFASLASERSSRNTGTCIKVDRRNDFGHNLTEGIAGLARSIE